MKLLKIWTVIFLFRNMGPGNVMKSPLGDSLTFPWTLWDSNRASRGCICCVYEGYAHYWFVVQSLSCVQLFMTLWTAARQASLSFTISQSLFKFVSIKPVMPSSHLILCRPLLLLLSIFPSIMVFTSELAIPIRWPKYWSFSSSINPCNEYSGLISFRID